MPVPRTSTSGSSRSWTGTAATLGSDIRMISVMDPVTPWGGAAAAGFGQESGRKPWRAVCPVMTACMSGARVLVGGSE
ncbi:hypothetical protein IQ64_22465 [Streptomyces stelliscabiei]|nr:hypothetical protein IQ64_22465 [Streptomyces stelliscabiei]